MRQLVTNAGASANTANALGGTNLGSTASGGGALGGTIKKIKLPLSVHRLTSSCAKPLEDHSQLLVNKVYLQEDLRQASQHFLKMSPSSQKERQALLSSVNTYKNGADLMTCLP